MWRGEDGRRREGEDSRGGGHSELGGISLTATEERARATATSRSATDSRRRRRRHRDRQANFFNMCAPTPSPCRRRRASAVVPRSLARLPSHAQAAGLGQAPPQPCGLNRPRRRRGAALLDLCDSPLRFRCSHSRALAGTIYSKSGPPIQSKEQEL